MENTENKGIFARIWDWFKNLTTKGLLGAILIAFIIIIILMSASYLPSVISRISSSLSAALYSIFVPAENATMTADKKIINSGEDFTVSFKEGDATDGIFTVSYACDPNLDLMSVEGASLKKIDCDKRYYLLNDTLSIKLRAITTNESVVRLVVEGAFENNENQKVESIGVVRVTIKNDAVGTTVNNTPVAPVTPVTTVTPVTPTVPTYVAPVYTYKTSPDLAVRLLQTGLLSGNNIITNRTVFSNQEMVGIKFEIRNDGDLATGPWYFTATLPSLSTPLYTSPLQNSLRSGESIIFTLGFSNLTNQYSSLITINADPNNAVLESNEGNNMITSAITNTGYNNNNYNYDYNYNNGCYVNGYFTYNCLDYNYNYDYDYNNNGVDLSVDILDVGRMTSSGNFVADSSINEGDDAAIRFRVTNDGDENSGRWDYTVDFTPSYSNDTYERNNMSSLAPGQSTVVTVTFDNASDTGTNRFRVKIDPDDNLGEDDRNNNTATETIYID